MQPASTCERSRGLAFLPLQWVAFMLFDSMTIKAHMEVRGLYSAMFLKEQKY